MYLGSDDTNEAVRDFGDATLHNVQVQALEALQDVALEAGLGPANQVDHHLVGHVRVDLHTLQRGSQHHPDPVHLFLRNGRLLRRSDLRIGFIRAGESHRRSRLLQNLRLAA